MKKKKKKYKINYHFDPNGPDLKDVLTELFIKYLNDLQKPIKRDLNNAQITENEQK